MKGFPMAAGLLSLAASAAAAQSIDDGLVSRWSFEEAAGDTFVDGPGSNDAVHTLGPSWGPFRVADAPAGVGAGATCLEFDGHSELEMTPEKSSIANTPYGIQSEFTIAFWVKPAGTIPLPLETTGYSPVDPVIADQRFVVAPEILWATNSTYQPGPGHAAAGVSVGTNGICVILNKDKNDSPWARPVLVQEIDFSSDPGVWRHVTVAFSADRPSLYVDGLWRRDGLEIGYSVHPGSWIGGCSYRIQGNCDPFYGPYLGRLDEVRIYSRTLDSSEVRTLAGIEPNPTGSPEIQPPVKAGSTARQGTCHAAGAPPIGGPLAGILLLACALSIRRTRGLAAALIVVAGAWPAWGQATAVVESLEVSVTPGSVGDESMLPGVSFVSVTIDAKGLPPVNTVGLSLYFDPALLICMGGELGDFYKGPIPLVLKNDVVSPGRYCLVASITGGAVREGDWNLLKVSFLVTGSGHCPLDLGPDIYAGDGDGPDLYSTPGFATPVAGPILLPETVGSGWFSNDGTYAPDPLHPTPTPTPTSPPPPPVDDGKSSTKGACGGSGGGGLPGPWSGIVMVIAAWILQSRRKV